MQPTLPTPAELETMLAARLGLTDHKPFIEPEYRLGDVWAFTDMKQAVERLYKAIKGGEHIGIYADYDCDGIPGAVVLIDLFKKLGVMDRVHVYIPDRHDEGYGVSKIGIDALEEKGVTLMITVDVGITAIAEVADAQSRGIDVVLTDHHAPLAEFPAAYALVHPAKGSYVNQDPCGAAMAFYLVCAFLETYRAEFAIPDGWEKWLLDLVGFATLSDMVPLTGENRMLAMYGLFVTRKTRRVGLRLLLEKNGIALSNLIESDLTFTVAPRLNAASRMDTPMLAFELLSTDDPKRALEIVHTLDEINTLRKSLVAQIVKVANASVKYRILNESLGAIVVIGNPEWRPAVLGLVANKLVETYGKSFFVWGEAGDGTIKGSCRMIDEHHAALLFQALPDGMILHAGGHQAAGGFSVAKEKIHFLEDALNAAIAKVDHNGKDKNVLDTISLPLASSTTRHLSVVRKFAPFGVGNAEPLFLFEHVTIVSTKMFGKAKEHIECLVRDSTGSATAFTFFATDALIQKLAPNEVVSLIGTLEAGWRGGVRVRIREVIHLSL
jgi:single-stranded-DNA-specific exonuclease